jgi:hypothetical protein
VPWGRYSGVFFPQNDDGAADLKAVIIMVAITVLLGAILLAMLLSFCRPFEVAFLVPSFLKITNISHTNEAGIFNYDSYVVFVNKGQYKLKNDNLKAVFYRNGERLDCRVETMHGYIFISTHHFTVQRMGGPGCSGDLWEPDEMIFIDFKDHLFHPGDKVTAEFIDKETDEVISRHTYTA